MCDNGTAGDPLFGHQTLPISPVNFFASTALRMELGLSLLQRRPRVLRSGPPGYEWTGTEAVAVHFLCLSGQRLRRNIFGSIRRSDACSRPHHSGRRGTRLGSRECLAGGSILRDAVSSVHGRHRRQRVGLQPLADRPTLVRCRPCDCWRGASGHRARARCRRRRPRTPAGQR